MKTKHFRAWPQEMGGKLVLCLAAMQLAALPLRAAEAATAVEVMSQAGTVISNGPATSEPAPSLWDEINKAINERRKDRHTVQLGEIVQTGRNVDLKSNEFAQTIVSIGGNVTVDGAVDDAVVCIGGNVSIQGVVRGDVVAIGGNIHLGPNARVGGNTVPVGGSLDREPGARVGGASPQIGWGPLGRLPFHGLASWMRECVFLARPLAPGVHWLWGITGALFLIYLLVAVLFPRPVEACVSRLDEQPASTFFVGLLTIVVVPLLLGALLITGIGIIAIPFLLVAVLVAQWFGKVALCEYCGQQFGRQLKLQAMAHPVAAFLVGWLIITALYFVPFLGLVIFLLVSIWSLGTAAVAAFGGARRERPTQTLPPIASPAPLSAMAAAVPPSQSSQPSQPIPEPLGPEPPPSEPPLISPQPAGSSRRLSSPAEALALARSGFWPRIGAAFLDFIIVLFASSYISSHVYWLWRPFFPILAVAYFAGMIAWRGTTVGGIVLNLKVVRVDGETLTFAVALVRALAAWLSAVVLGLGFFWILWDPERQSWHDKIAGTVVVRVPKTEPLV